MVAQGFNDLGETTSDNLIAGEFPRVVRLATVSGGNLKRGAILGKITSNGKCVLCVAAATDGSKDVYAVLAEDVDASSEDKQAVAYLTGEFNKTALKANAEIDTLIPKLRAKSIFVKENQAY